MGILKEIFLDLEEWWYLVPDQSIFSSGGKTTGDLLNLAARHKDGKWIIVYLASKDTCSIDLSKMVIGSKVNASWIDPQTGKSVMAGSYPNEGVVSFITPDELIDALLLLKSESE
jgi:hypothetical protein